MSAVTFDPAGSQEYPHIAAVEWLLGGVGRLLFVDGTQQFAESEQYPDVVFSPRLETDDLEKFCAENISHYQAYYEANEAAIDAGDELPAIDRFWELSPEVVERCEERS